MYRVKSKKVLGIAARRLGMAKNAGLRPIAEAAAKAIGADVPLTRGQQWVLVRTFCANNHSAPRQQKQYRTFGRVDVESDAFLQTYEWRRLRMLVLTKRGARCECCGATPKDGVRMHVDHIKPRRLFPVLALDESNLQILCEVCNHGKGNWDQTDWREPESKPAVPDYAPCWSRPRLVKTRQG